MTKTWMCITKQKDWLAMSLRSRWFVYANIGNKDSCWTWSGPTNAQGYGIFGYKGKQHTAYRTAYELFIGPIPNGLCVDHLCRNPLCCNPFHLEPVTSKENTLRGISFAATQSKQTHCKRGHELSIDNLMPYGLPLGSRACKICHYERRRSRRERLKAAGINWKFRG